MRRCIAELQPGMVLASDVTGLEGRILLSAGTELEDRHLRILNSWGVSEAEVRPESVSDAMDRAEAARLVTGTALADAFFARADTSAPPMAALKAACARFYADLPDAERAALAPPDKDPTDPGPAEPPAAPRFPDAAAFVAGDEELAVFPAVYHRIMAALHNPLSTAGSLADIIAGDPGLAARLLGLVNSALYGFSQPVDSLSRAVSLVGTQGLTQLALAVTVMDKFQGLDSEHFSMAAFWRHSVACAALCRILSTQARAAAPDLCFVAGLLHDVGRLVMLQKEPAAMNAARHLGRARAIAPDAAERLVFGFDHCQAAGVLFRMWHFPEEIIVATVSHHAPPPPGGIEAAVCAVGEVLATAMRYGREGDGIVPAMPTGAWKALGLPESTLAVVMTRARRQIGDLLTIFQG